MSNNANNAKQAALEKAKELTRLLDYLKQRAQEFGGERAERAMETHDRVLEVRDELMAVALQGERAEKPDQHD